MAKQKNPVRAAFARAKISQMAAARESGLSLMTITRAVGLGKWPSRPANAAKLKKALGVEQ